MLVIMSRGKGGCYGQSGTRIFPCTSSARIELLIAVAMPSCHFGLIVTGQQIPSKPEKKYSDSRKNENECHYQNSLPGVM